MPSLSRFTQKIFGLTAGANEISQFGSFEAGSPAYTTNPGVIQSLTQYLKGWLSATSGYSPAVEDMNALFYLVTYQLSYLMQAGIAEYDPGTTYFAGKSIVQYNGDIFSCLVDDTINILPTVTSNWRSLSADIISAKFTLEDATVPVDNISGPHYQSTARSLESVAISMLNSGRSGSTTIRLNVYRAGALNQQATASIPATGGPKSLAATLSATLSLFVGDIITCDVLSCATGTPTSLSVEYFGGSGVGGGEVGGGGVSPGPYIYTVTSLDISNGGFTLAYTPADPTRVLIQLQGNVASFPGIDYQVGAPEPDDFLSWTGLGLESIVQAGDKFLITYSA